MIDQSDKQRIAQMLHIPNLKVETYRRRDGSDEIFSIYNFWVVKFKYYLGYNPMEDLIIAMVNTKNNRYGLILLPDHLKDSDNYQILLPIELDPNGNDEVLQAIGRSNFVIKKGLIQYLVEAINMILWWQVMW